jgi:hypothetical protein
MTPTPEQWPALLEAKATLEQAVRQASLASTVSSTTPMLATTNTAVPSGDALQFPWGTGALPTVDGLRNTPEMQQMAAQLFSNPQQLQAMLQVLRLFC